MLSDELLFELNEYELIDIAKRIHVPTTIGIPAKKKSKRELSFDVYHCINDMEEETKKQIIREITTHGRMIFTCFRTTPLNTSAHYKIPKDYVEFKDTINGFVVYMPEKIEEMINGYCVIIPNSTNLVFIIKKDFGCDIGSAALSVAKNVCQFMRIEPLFKSDIVKNIFSKVATPKLNTPAKLIKSKKKKYRVFYDQHKCDGEFLTISTKIASGRPKIEKNIQGLKSIDQSNVDSLVKSKKINSLASTPDIINYSIVKTPACIRDTLVSITVNILTSDIGQTNHVIRYKLAIYQNEIKVLIVDTNLNDIKDIVDIILQIH